MNELHIDIIMIDGIIFGLLYSEYEEYREVILPFTCFGLRIRWS